MKALIIAAAATLFMTSAAYAEDMNMKKMNDAECQAAMAACKDDACKKALQDNNGCSAPAASSSAQ